MWEAVLCDNVGKVRAFLEPQLLSVTPRICGFADAELKLDMQAIKSGVLDVASRALKLYRKGVLRFHGRVGEPLDDDPLTTTLRAFDPFYWLNWRTVQADLNYASEDAGVVARALIQAQNDRGAAYTTRMSLGTLQAGPKRPIVVPRNKIVSQAILELAQMADSFFFQVDPVDDTPGTHGSFVVKYPLAGTDRPRAKFEYGEGTLANVDTFTRARKVPTHLVIANRQGGTIGAEQRISIPNPEYDHQEVSITVPDSVSDSYVLEQAAARLKPTPPMVYSVKPVDGDPAPALYDDFLLGDTVRLTVKHGRISDVNLPARLNEATVTWDGLVESLGNVVLEVV